MRPSSREALSKPSTTGITRCQVSGGMVSTITCENEFFLTTPAPRWMAPRPHPPSPSVLWHYRTGSRPWSRTAVGKGLYRRRGYGCIQAGHDLADHRVARLQDGLSLEDWLSYDEARLGVAECVQLIYLEGVHSGRRVNMGRGTPFLPVGILEMDVVFCGYRIWGVVSAVTCENDFGSLMDGASPPSPPEFERRRRDGTIVGRRLSQIGL